ncbi:hypothetical protein NIES2104_57880 [Leptolyngbya sp. NIES-2104]|nr:hypothetical protein NIES2104_57880 [Leptolyngbya sp. NIES-2104]
MNVTCARGRNSQTLCMVETHLGSVFCPDARFERAFPWTQQGAQHETIQD